MDASFVTSNATLAAVGRRQYAAEQMLAGHASWLTPPTLSQNAWLTRCWGEARYRSEIVPTLLSRSQELLLWQKVIEDDRLSLFDSYATAQLASRAARLVAEWEVTAETEAWSVGADARHFKRWLGRFQERCRSEHWTTRADLWRLLPEWIKRGWCAPEPALFVLNSRRPPVLGRLAERFGDRISLRSLEPLAADGPTPGHAMTTVEEEIAFAARWARGAYEADKTQSVAIFVANLDARSAEIDRAFRDVFYPGACRGLTDARLSTLVEAPAAYNLIASRPLSHRPLVASALQLLQLFHERIPVSVAGTLLRSRWIKGAAAERNLRARADADLRRPRDLDVSFDELVASSARCPVLASIWPGVRRFLRQSKTQSFSSWARCFADLLAAFDWPGDNELTAAEQEQLEGWRNALSELSSLSLVAETADLETALAELKRLLKQASSGIDSGLLAPVQILDLDQAPGLQFDSALITGLAEESWPPPRRAAPFLPLSLQRKYEVPGSSQAALDMDREELLAALFGSAPSVTAAWHGRIAASVQRFVHGSPEPEQRVWDGKSSWLAYKPALLDELEDTYAPACHVGEGVLGGTGVIKSQSHCPFQAFVKYRLYSRSLEHGRLGFDERERGGHLHQVLQLIWQRLGDSATLKAMPRNELEVLVAQCAREAVRRPSETPFEQIVTAVELARLQEITVAWLDVERQRLQPFTVEKMEAEHSIELAGLPLQLRVDRIDRVPNGGLILIDYKSGIQNTRKFDCPRPDEPQLLVYAAGLAEHVEGIVFGQLKREDIRPVGLTREAHFPSSRKKMVDVAGASWETRVWEWRDEVERLAEQFKAGYAAVDPRRGACDFCEQKILCRVSERAGESDSEAE